MTSWQDQPPQTRRQAREHERAVERQVPPSEAEQLPVSRRAATVAPTPGGQVPEVATPFSFASTQRDSTPQPQAPTDAPPMRPRTPRYEDLSFDSLLAASHAGGPANAAPVEDRAPAPVAYLPGAAQPSALQDQQPRPAAPVDQPRPATPVPYTPPVAVPTPVQPVQQFPSAYSGQGAAAPTRAGDAGLFGTAPSAPASAQQPAPPQSFDGPALSVPAPSPEAAFAAGSDAERAASDGRPLTRRERRAMLQAQQANEAIQTDSDLVSPGQQTPSVAATPTPGFPSTPATPPSYGAAPSFDPSTSAGTAVPNPASSVPAPYAASPFGDAPVPAAADRAADPLTASFADLLGAAGSDEVQEQTRRVVPPATAHSSASQTPQAPISAVPAPTSAQNVSPASPVVVPGVVTPQSAAQAGAGDSSDGPKASGPATDPQLRARAAGHWSTMNEDDVPVDGNTPRSAVSSGSVTTANALILPSIPSAGLATSPLTSTGEVIVTGSIELPRSLGSTGQHPDHFDSSDIDRLFEETDAAPPTSSVAPVRASRAVATHTSTRGMITPPKSRGNRLPVTLAVTAAFLAIGVAALLVAGYVFHAF